MYYVLKHIEVESITFLYSDNTMIEVCVCVCVFSNNTGLEKSKSSSHVTTDKPALRRSNTTGSTGARPSKKTLLLRWCQKVTEEYDVCVYVYIRMYTCTCACMYGCCVYVYVYVCMYVCTYVCVYVCMCVCR